MHIPQLLALATGALALLTSASPVSGSIHKAEVARRDAAPADLTPQQQDEYFAYYSKGQKYGFKKQILGIRGFLEQALAAAKSKNLFVTPASRLRGEYSGPMLVMGLATDFTARYWSYQLVPVIEWPEGGPTLEQLLSLNVRSYEGKRDQDFYRTMPFSVSTFATLVGAVGDVQIVGLVEDSGVFDACARGLSLRSTREITDSDDNNAWWDTIFNRLRESKGFTNLQSAN